MEVIFDVFFDETFRRMERSGLKTRQNRKDVIDHLNAVISGGCQGTCKNICYYRLYTQLYSLFINAWKAIICRRKKEVALRS